MPKYKLIIQLYELQGDICPLCKQSMFEEITLWVRWRDQRGRKLVTGEVRIKRKDINLNIDHIVAVASGGTDDISNLALTHRSCNDIRGHVTIYDKRPTRTKSVPKAPQRL